VPGGLTVTAHISLCMTQGSIAAAAVDSLADGPSGLEIVDFDNYVKIMAPDTFQLDLDDIGDRVGRVLSMADFLSSVSSFTGRVVMGERTFEICAAMPGILSEG
jgi:hypothetical protein